MGYVDSVIENVRVKNANEPEFIQTVEEVLGSLRVVIDSNDEYEKVGLLERLVEPERQIQFRVPWVDDNGKVQVNRGFRVQFNSALGPYKGGCRFHPTVNMGIIKFLGFEQILKNSLTGLPIGGGKGGSDFNPTGKSDGEVMRFCQAFMSELFRHIGPQTDSPAGDVGVGAREIGFLFGQYKKLMNQYNESVTGKGLAYGGLNGRTEATGYGIVYYADAMLNANGQDLKGKEVALSGFGNVTWGTAEKLNELGAKVVTISGPDGYIYDPDGVREEKVDYLLELRGSGQDICAPYADKFKSATFYAGKRPWEVEADLYIPCATQNEIMLEDAKNIVKSGAKFVCEGSNMSSSNDAIAFMQENGIIVGPSKAANAGGVACSCIEMGQNAGHTVFSADQVHKQLKDIMVGIYDSCQSAAEEYGFGKEGLVAGSNIAGFLKVSEAMIAQGIV